jgi:hypothetical protein
MPPWRSDGSSVLVSANVAGDVLSHGRSSRDGTQDTSFAGGGSTSPVPATAFTGRSVSHRHRRRDLRRRQHGLRHADGSAQTPRHRSAGPHTDAAADSTGHPRIDGQEGFPQRLHRRPGRGVDLHRPEDETERDRRKGDGLRGSSARDQNTAPAHLRGDARDPPQPGRQRTRRDPFPYEDDVGTQDHWTNRCLHTSAHHPGDLRNEDPRALRQAEELLRPPRRG